MPEAHADDNSVIRLCVFDRIIAGYERELQQLRRQIEDQKRQKCQSGQSGESPTTVDFRIRKAA